MHRARTRGLLLASLALVAAACSEDPTDIIEGDPLTEEEAAALAEVVAGTLFAGSEETEDPAAVSGPAMASGSYEVEVEAPCDFGGSVALEGSIQFDQDDETGDGTLEFGVVTTHDACGVESEDGIQFVLDGSPNLTADFTIVSEGSAFSFSGEFGGAIEWATDDKEGRCSMDVEFSLAGDVQSETGSATISGRVCGITFSQELDIT